ncbi:MAG: hypothetical protein RR620_12275 [Clostridium sp.]
MINKLKSFEKLKLNIVKIDPSFNKNESMDTIVLKRGRIKIELTMQLLRINQSDRVGIFLGDSFYKDISIIPSKEYTLSIKEYIDVFKNYEDLSIINNSDDFIFYKDFKGGIGMDQIQILSHENLCNKSIDVTLNTQYQYGDIATITSTTTGTIYNCVVYPNSVYPMDLTKVSVIVGTTAKGECRLADDGSYYVFSDEDKESQAMFLPSYDNYKLVIIRGEVTTPEYDFTLGYVNPLNNGDIDITSYGDRILNIEFKYPVLNMKKFTTLKIGTSGIEKTIDESLPCESTDTNPSYYKVLTNFFCMFNGELSYDVSNNFNNWFNGFFL